MNYHTNTWINEQVKRHLNEAKNLYSNNQIIGVFLQGSQNYGLDFINSDIDTKCLLTPTFYDIAFDKKMVSTTHVLDNNEHLDAKDIRAYISCFRKQNLNFLEILFTDYFVLNPTYAEQWNRLIDNREAIARMNVHRAVKSMKGIALEKYHAMEHPYPTKLDLIDKYGFDGKQVHHLIRVDDYLTRYIAGEPYLNCLKPTAELVPHLLEYKLHKIPLDVAREEAKEVLAHVTEIADAFCALHPEEEDKSCRALLEDVQYNIMRISVEYELFLN